MWIWSTRFINFVFSFLISFIILLFFLFFPTDWFNLDTCLFCVFFCNKKSSIQFNSWYNWKCIFGTVGMCPSFWKHNFRIHLESGWKLNICPKEGRIILKGLCFYMSGKMQKISKIDSARLLLLFIIYYSLVGNCPKRPYFDIFFGWGWP